MRNIIEYIQKWDKEFPDKPAIIHDGGIVTYHELLVGMIHRHVLPIPLLGESWDDDFCLYTTGTTGKPKGVIISQVAVIANSENLIYGQGFHQNLVFIIAGDMTHIGCWSKIFPTLMQGGTLLILKDGLKEINKFFKAFDLPLEEYGLPLKTRFATFLVPSNIRILLQLASDRLQSISDRIEFIETGAAPISYKEMTRMCELLPSTRLYNTYASTETGIISTYNYNDGRCIAGCLGKPLPNSTVIITEDGHIACKGTTLMTHYRGDDTLTNKILKDGTLFTNDNGYLDGEGMLHILGRDDDVINVGGYKVAPSEVEEVALEVESIKDCICIPRQHPILGFSLSLLIVLKDGELLDKHNIARYIASKLDDYKVPLTYIVVDKIERTFNGKLNRKYYNEQKHH